MPQVKYIADGFTTDSKTLLEDFVLENSMEFPVFTNIWKKHYFSLIYMGRPTKKELNEFTNEIFFLTGKYLFSRSRKYQVGGIYLWYGLYRNQIVEPPTRIRITIDQVAILLEVWEFAKQQNIQSLLFVIIYLFENAFEYVALPTLMGPFMRKDPEQPQEQQNLNEIEVGTELEEIHESGLLEDIYEAAKLYSKFKESQYPTDEFKEYIDELNNLLSSGADSGAKISSKINSPKPVKPGFPKSAIGSRRAQLKSAQFSRAIFPNLDSDVNEVSEMDDFTAEVSSASEDMATEIRCPSLKVPKKERKVGRPRKNALKKVTTSDSESSDIELPNGDLLSVVKKRKCVKARRIRCYYEDSTNQSME